MLTPALLSTFFTQPEVVDKATGLWGVITHSKSRLQFLSFQKSDVIRIYSFNASTAHSCLSWEYAWKVIKVRLFPFCLSFLQFMKTNIYWSLVIAIYLILKCWMEETLVAAVNFKSMVKLRVNLVVDESLFLLQFDLMKSETSFTSHAKIYAGFSIVPQKGLICSWLHQQANFLDWNIRLATLLEIPCISKCFLRFSMPLILTAFPLWMGISALQDSVGDCCSVEVIAVALGLMRQWSIPWLGLSN